MTFSPSFTASQEKQKVLKVSKTIRRREFPLELTIVNEVIELDEVVSVVVDVDGLSIVIEFGSEVDANDGVGVGFLALYDDLVFVGLVVEAMELSLDVIIVMFFLDGVNIAVIEIDVVLIEVSDEVGEDDFLDFDARNDEVVVLIGRQGLLVANEELDDAFIELIEGWVANSGLAEFQGGRSVAPDVVELGSVAKKLTSHSLETAVVTRVDTAASTFDDVTEDVQTLGLVEREELLLGSDDVSGVNGVHEPLFESVNVLDEILVVGG